MEKDCLTLLSKSIKDDLEKLLRNESMWLSDIKKVFLVTDMDGVYIDNLDIVYKSKDASKKNSGDPIYTDRSILTTHVSGIKNRNWRKRTNIEYLLQQPYIELEVKKEKAQIPFGLFLCRVILIM